MSVNIAWFPDNGHNVASIFFFLLGRVDSRAPISGLLCFPDCHNQLVKRCFETLFYHTFVKLIFVNQKLFS